MKRLLFALIVLLATPALVPSSLYGAGTCWNGGYSGTTPWTVLDGSGGSASAAYADVNYCINTVAAAEDTINITKTGTVDWGSALTITKGITLVGPGASSLTIRNTLGGTTYFIRYSPSDYSKNWAFDFSGFTIDLNGGNGLALGASSAPEAGFAKNNKIRVHHNTFVDTASGTSNRALRNMGDLYGVVDSNTFTNAYPITNYGSGYGADWWWGDNDTPQNTIVNGSADFMYYEDNTFTGSPLIMMNAQYHARYVARYNSWTSDTTGNTFTDSHGQNLSATMAPSFGYEAYGNLITKTNSASGSGINVRTAHTLAFCNASSIASSTGLYIAVAFASEDAVCPENNAANKIPHDNYFWLNMKNGYTGALATVSASANLPDGCGGLDDVPSLGRDVFSDTSTPGITCGVQVDIPGTCAVGQGYWATSQSCSDLTGMVGANPSTPISGTLYKCTETNTWTAYYTPYTYPHPLRSQHGRFSGSGSFNVR